MLLNFLASDNYRWPHVLRITTSNLEDRICYSNFESQTVVGFVSSEAPTIVKCLPALWQLINEQFKRMDLKPQQLIRRIWLQHMKMVEIYKKVSTCFFFQIPPLSNPTRATLKLRTTFNPILKSSLDSEVAYISGELNTYNYDQNRKFFIS